MKMKGIALVGVLLVGATLHAQQFTKTSRAGNYKVQVVAKQSDLKVGENRIFKVKVYQPKSKSTLLKRYTFAAGMSMPDNPGIRMMPPSYTLHDNGVVTIKAAFPVAGKYELGLDITPERKKPVYTKFILVVME